MRALFLVSAIIATASAALAQDARMMTEQEWRELALGKTLTYSIDGAFFALERYAETGNRVELQFADGSCFPGTWTYANQVFCFDWGFEEEHCFRHVAVGERIFVINVIDGEDTGRTQEMTAVSDAPLACGLQMS